MNIANKFGTKEKAKCFRFFFSTFSKEMLSDSPYGFIPYDNKYYVGQKRLIFDQPVSHPMIHKNKLVPRAVGGGKRVYYY